MEPHNEYHCSNCKWIRRSENRAFFIKRQEKKEGKSKNHHDYIQSIIKQWSEVSLNNKPKKIPFLKNLYFDIFESIKEKDLYSEASSHISSTKNTDYINCYNSYKKLEHLQNNNNRIINNYINKLKEKISTINPDNLINYIIVQFLNMKLHNSENIDSEIKGIKENHPDVIIRNYEESEDKDFEDLSPEYIYKLSHQEKDIFDSL